MNNSLSSPDGRGPHVAIVGGGASGTLTAVQLLRCAASGGLPLRVTMIDRDGRHGLGLAYSTEIDAHLLNAMACQMSALPDDHEHLIKWANAAGRCHLPEGMPEVLPTTFVPRPAYGRYLLDTLADAERQAQPAAHLTRITAEAVSIQRTPAGQPVRILLSDGASIDADTAVLATGNSTARLPFPVPDSDAIVADPWQRGALSRLLRLLGDGTGPSDVVIIGTGLTMVDLAIAITAANPEARVHAISRHGLLPRTHPGRMPQGQQPQGQQPQGQQPIWLPVLSRTTGPVRLTEVMWQVRAAIAASPANWQDVMAAMRPLVPGLWSRLPLADKQSFLGHLARYWEVHRHLIPPPTASRITALRATGRLMIHRGHVLDVATEESRLRVLLDADDGLVTLPADWLVNSTGSAGDITRVATPLLRDLFAAGTARPDPLRLGIDATTQGAVLDASGAPSDVLFTLGPPLRGLWYETTAVPEIREQAAALARLITSAASPGQGQDRRPGSAA